MGWLSRGLFQNTQETVHRFLAMSHSFTCLFEQMMTCFPTDFEVWWVRQIGHE